jgi:hypothetical protein
MFIPDEDQIISKTYMTLLRRGKYQTKTLRKPGYIVRLFVILNVSKCSSILLSY